MRKYIFYTTEGFTSDNDLESVDNCQILGWQDGQDEKEAFDNFKKENEDISFEEIRCQELVDGRVYYF